MVDPDDELTDVRMPEQRTDGHVTLLVAEYLAARADRAEPVPVDRLRAHVKKMAAEHASYWRRGVTEPGADAELLAVALDKLRALRLVADAPVRPGEPAAVLARPAIARYAVEAPTIRDGQETGTRSKTGAPVKAKANAKADAATRTTGRSAPSPTTRRRTTRG
jgi:uncharacterized protein (TIGR02678 family)